MDRGSKARRRGAEGGDKSVGECDGQCIPGANVHVMGLRGLPHTHSAGWLTAQLNSLKTYLSHNPHAAHALYTLYTDEPCSIYVTY